MEWLEILGKAFAISVPVGLVCYVGVLALNMDLRRKPIQFSIRDLLFFTFLWAMCFSQVRVEPIGRQEFAWGNDWIILSTWLVLAAFYVWRRCCFALLVHGLGVLFVIIAVIVTVARGQVWTEWARSMSIQMFLGSFLGLAVFSAIMLLGLFRRDRSSREE
jgi:hypothetical protein